MKVLMLAIAVAIFLSPLHVVPSVAQPGKPMLIPVPSVSQAPTRPERAAIPDATTSSSVPAKRAEHRFSYMRCNRAIGKPYLMTCTFTKPTIDTGSDELR